MKRSNFFLLRSDKPSSTKARNIGIQKSKNDIILFSDDDVLVDPDTVKLFYETMKKSQIALCAGVSVGDRQIRKSLLRKIFGTVVGMQCLWKKGGYIVKHTMRGRYELNDKQNIYNTDWAMGYFFGVKKSLLDKWSINFDEKLIEYAYAEDLDFSLRYCRCAKQEKLGCILNQEIYIKHLATQEWRIPSKKAMYFLVANRLYLFYKNFPGYNLLPMVWNNFCYSFMLGKKEGKIFRKISRICMNNIEQLKDGKIEGVYRSIINKI